MSAFMIDRDHVSYLVDAARAMPRREFSYWWEGKRHYLKSGDDVRAVAIGNILWSENRRSINARYPDTIDNPDGMPGVIGESYDFTRDDLHRYYTFKAVEVIKAVKCYQYQACEHKGWEASEAYAITQELIAYYIDELPGYEDAPWGAPRAVNSAYKAVGS